MTSPPIPVVPGFDRQRCIVTGGAGFIGSTLVRVLLKSGADVVVYDNTATGQWQNVDCRDEIGAAPQLHWGDVRDRERFSRVVRADDVVFHLACLGVRHSIHSPLENETVNSGGTLSVLAASREAGVRRFVHVSSSEVYGTARSAPMTEDHPTDPHTVYGASKLAGECYARAFHRCYGFPAVVVRPFNTYGPRSHFEGDSGEVLPRFVLQALVGQPLVIFGDGTQTRDLTHVCDTAAGIALAATRDAAIGGTFNLGSGSEIAIADLATLVKRVAGTPALSVTHIEPRPGDVLRLIADSREAAHVLGFRADIALERGVSDLIDRFRALPAATLAQLAARMVVKKLAMSDATPPRVPIVRPSLGDDEIAAVSRVIRSGWLSQGAEVAAFEREFAEAVGAPHAVAVSSCTTALQAALLAVGVQPGDDVVTVSHSFVATANAVVAAGARPRFVDVRPETLGMDPVALERAITPRTTAILCVHQIGIPCDLERIVAIAAARGIPVVEDAACAIGSEVRYRDRWEPIGRPHGAIACFSFHPRKVVTTGDGGMLTTADAALAQRVRLLRQHAMTVLDTVRHGSTTVTFEEYLEPAFNFRMTDLQAAIGRVQLAKLPSVIEERRALAGAYARALGGHPLFDLLIEEPWWRTNWQSYPVFLKEGSGVEQVTAMQHLLDRGVACKRGISNAHQEPAYAGKDNWSKAASESLTTSERLRDRTILLPLFHGMTRAEQDRVVVACRHLPRGSIA